MRKYSKKKILEDKTGEGYIFQMFYNELQKYKKPVGMAEAEDVLTKLGYDLEDLQHSPTLNTGLNMAISAVNDEVYEDNRPQPADYYHFTDKDGKKIKGFALEWYITQEIKEALTNFNFKIDFNKAVTNYLICNWGTLNKEADDDNNRSLEEQGNARIIARYHTCKGDIYIKTEGTSKTLIMFTLELVEMYENKLKKFKYTEKSGNYSVYMHVTPEEKLYIGMTEDIKRRYGYNGNGYRTQADFYQAINKYGWNNIDHKVLASDLSKAEAEKAEHEAIVTLNAHKNGYNQNDGGSGIVGKPVRCITDGKIFKSLTLTAEHYNMGKDYVCKSCRGVVKTAKGLQFEYV